MEYKPMDNKNHIFNVSSWPNAIAHMDADAFFVSCEQAANPSLSDKCVVVGKERGIVTALSYSAKSRGIKRGMLISEAKRICPSLIVIESDYERYSMFSIRMFDILRNFSPAVEEYSIDEAFIDLSGLRRLYNADYLTIAKMIQDEIQEKLNISVSVGVAPTKVLAKIASKINKPHGVFAIKANRIQKYIKNIKIEDIWGIGKNTAALLNKLNIYTAEDFARKDELYLKRFLSKPYIQIYHELRGKSVMRVEPNKKSAYKSISKAKSFHKPTSSKQILFAELTKNLENACTKARMYKLAAKKLIVFLKTSDFQTSSIKLKLQSPSNTPIILMDTLKRAFDMIYNKNLEYRQTGVVLTELETKSQYRLFEDRARIEKIVHLYKAVDKINKRYGNNKIHLAVESLAVSKNEHIQRVGIPVVEIEV